MQFISPGQILNWKASSLATNLATNFTAFHQPQLTSLLETLQFSILVTFLVTTLITSDTHKILLISSLIKKHRKGKRVPFLQENNSIKCIIYFVSVRHVGFLLTQTALQVGSSRSQGLLRHLESGGDPGNEVEWKSEIGMDAGKLERIGKNAMIPARRRITPRGN